MNNSQALGLRRERLPELQLVRACAIIGVLSVHSTSFAVSAMTSSQYFWTYNFLNIFMKFGTPTFIFLSSLVLFYNYYSEPITLKRISGFYKKRLLYIIVPYTVFSVFYFGLLHYLHYQGRPLGETMESFFTKLLTGKAYTHLYFVFISIQFYLLFPLILWLLKKMPRLARWAVPIGLGIQWTFILLNKYYWQVPNKGSWALSYIAYFMLGAFVGIYYPKLKAWLTICRTHATPLRTALWIILWLGWIAAGLGHVYVYYNSRLYGTAYNSTLYELMWNLHTYLGVIVLLQLASLVYRGAKPRVTDGLMRLGAVSFGIYLIHPFFLLVYRQFPPETGSSLMMHLWYAGGFAVALMCSWIVVEITVRWLPGSWVIFGRVPKSKSTGQQQDIAASRSLRT
ncbi:MULTISPECIES: acyltransferase [Paenibacillus]|uniref:Acyltransferase family protein n=1 Tax=Paenibacillus campinasensis TaxID=66347 RepID=A0ABW9SZA0_9BACL|nr:MULTISPECIES: acyltransferase [Paenibacillus]MUG66340.1 acyltransferase family protein [Paenibacillus campinasensis]PAK54459.1 acyltransferase [Paenibacillus sp. 7541]